MSGVLDFWLAFAFCLCCNVKMFHFSPGQLPQSDGIYSSRWFHSLILILSDGVVNMRLCCCEESIYQQFKISLLHCRILNTIRLAAVDKV